MTEVSMYFNSERWQELKKVEQDKKLLDRTIQLEFADVENGWFALTSQGVEYYLDYDDMFESLEKRPDVDLRNTPIQRARLSATHF